MRALLYWAYFGVLAGGPAAGAGILAAPTAAAPTPAATPTATPAPAPLTDQQQHKLDLEIRKLEQDTGRAAGWRQWLPAGSVAVAFLAGGWTVFQYFRDQRQGRQIRVQEQFGENLATLAEYVEAGNSSSVRVVRALANLSQLVPLQPVADDSRNRVTDLIATGVTDDLDFEDPQQVRFDALCLERWPAYRDWLTANPGKRGFILYRYQQALRVLYELHPDYYRAMRLDASGGFVVDDFIEERQYLHFQRLVNGYQLQLRYFTDAAARAAAAAEFGTILHNPTLAAGLF